MDPFPEWAEMLWDAWDTQVLVLWSLSLQITLVILGSRRRYITGVWVRVIVWTAYLMADWVATVALGKLSDISKDDNKSSIDPNAALTALWAPLLLMHLGGPDSITAYSMEDNQLWIRHLLGLVVEVGVAVYVILRCWTNSWFSILTLPLFFAGIIKYGERTWSLWSVSTDNSHLIKLDITDDAYHLLKEIPGVKRIIRACYVYGIYEHHIANSGIKSKGKLNLPQFMYDEHEKGDVVPVVECELGFMYNILYTKAPLVYTSAGLILRLISIFCAQFALWGYTFSTKHVTKDHVNVIVTYVLLVGAVVLDIYGVALLLYSDWGMLWLIKHHKKPLVIRVLRVLAPKALTKWRSWSNAMGQFNFLSFCLDKSPSNLSRILNSSGSEEGEETKLSRILKLFGLDRKYLAVTHEKNVPVKFIEKILSLVEEQEGEKDIHPTAPKWADRCLEQFFWSKEMGIDDSIFFWHIATDICYYCDESDTDPEPKKMSKMLSDYMMYVLVMRPEMLSVTSGDVLCENTSKNIKKIMKLRTPAIRDIKEACNMLLTSDEKYDPLLLLSYESTTMTWSAPKEAQQLARILMKREDRWTLISNVWVEILISAASHCQINNHAQQLRRGGEFMTLVLLFRTEFQDS